MSEPQVRAIDLALISALKYEWGARLCISRVHKLEGICRATITVACGSRTAACPHRAGLGVMILQTLEFRQRPRRQRHAGSGVGVDMKDHTCSTVAR